MGKLDGKVAIVTGATSGMGRDSAKLFAAEGAKVVVTGRNEERAKAVVDDIKAEGNEAIYVIADMANLDDIQKIFNSASSSSNERKRKRNHRKYMFCSIIRCTPRICSIC